MGECEKERPREGEIRASQIYQVFLSKEAVDGGDVWSSNSYTFIESERADHKQNGFRTLQLVLQSECCGYLKQDL